MAGRSTARAVGRRRRPVGEVLAAAPRLLGVVLRTSPGLTTGGKQLLELFVFRIAGHPRGCHASLLVATILGGRKLRARFGDATQVDAWYMDRTLGLGNADRLPRDNRAGRGRNDTMLQVTGITPRSR